METRLLPGLLLLLALLLALLLLKQKPLRGCRPRSLIAASCVGVLLIRVVVILVPVVVVLFVLVVVMVFLIWGGLRRKRLRIHAFLAATVRSV